MAYQITVCKINNLDFNDPVSMKQGCISYSLINQLVYLIKNKTKSRNKFLRVFPV